MTIYPDINALKAVIDARVIDNNANLIDEGDVRESMKDIVDTLDDLAEPPQNLTWATGSNQYQISNGTTAPIPIAAAGNDGLENKLASTSQTLPDISGAPASWNAGLGWNASITTAAVQQLADIVNLPIGKTLNIKFTKSDAAAGITLTTPSNFDAQSAVAVANLGTLAAGTYLVQIYRSAGGGADLFLRLAGVADIGTIVDDVLPLKTGGATTITTLNRAYRVDSAINIPEPAVVASKWFIISSTVTGAQYNGSSITNLTIFAQANEAGTAWEYFSSAIEIIATTTQGLLSQTGNSDGETRTVNGYYAAGDGITLTYEWVATSSALDDGVDATHPGLVITPTGHVGNGRWIARINNGTINAKWLGARGDQNNLQDEQPYIQRAIDLCIYGTTLWSIDWKCETVELPPGVYQTDDTIHLGYGETFHYCNLIGGQPSSGFINNEGSVIQPSFVDKPTINIQGGRRNVIQGIWIEGSVTTANTLLRGETDESLWDAIYDTVVPSTGISIDAYGGADPGGTPGVTKYADATYPAGLSLSQWNKSASVQPQIRDCRIRYFASAVVVSPSLNNFGNADFAKVRNCHIRYCKFGITSNESQNRMTTADDCLITDCFAAMGAGIYGTGKSGDIRMTQTNWDRCGYGFWIPDFSFTAQAVMENCRAEAVGAIAHIVNAATARTSVVIRDCKIGFIGNARDDFTAPHYHFYAHRATVVFTGNQITADHSTMNGRTVFLVGSSYNAAAGTGAMVVEGNTFYQTGTITRTQQTLGAEVAACFPTAHGKYPRVDVAANSPKLFHFAPATPSSQQQIITSGYAHDGTGGHSGTMPTATWNIRNGFFQLNNYLTVSPNDATYRVWVFKITAITASTITVQQINDCDGAGVPNDQAAVQAALASGGSWVSVSRGQQAVVGDRWGLEQTVQRPVLTTTPSAIDYSLGATAYIVLDEALEAISDISNLPVGAKLTLLCLKTNATDSISLDATNFTFSSKFTSATAGVAVGDPLIVQFIRMRQGSGANEIYASMEELRPGQGVTGARPTPAAAGNGTQWYDDTLNVPIWSDGTDWRDALGGIVT